MILNAHTDKYLNFPCKRRNAYCSATSQAFCFEVLLLKMSINLQATLDCNAAERWTAQNFAYVSGGKSTVGSWASLRLLVSFGNSL